MNQFKEMENIYNDKTSETQRVIDLGKILERIILNKKRIITIMAVVFVVSSLLIISVPRYYTTYTRVAPEIESAGGAGAISSLASQFGLELGDAASSTDAISPLLYPDLMDDNGFVSKLFDIQVTNCDGSISTNYYDYLTNYHSEAWWTVCFEAIGKIMPKFGISEIKTNGSEFDPYILNKKQFKIMELIRENVKFDYDKQTSVITIEVTDQDRLICKSMADSVRSRLLAFITEYRTNKARNDVIYYQDLVNDARDEYDKARHQYASFSDANTGIGLPSMKSKLEDMENNMQLKYNTYTALSAQLQAARSKLRERTPAFTVLQGAEAPIKPTGPKRMIFVAAMTILAFLATSAWFSRDLLVANK